MPFVSYAQNFEDVMLWRALHDVQGGFYIDIGAQSPDVDSVTRAFSESGWRGINVEPHPAFHSQLSERRPQDINLRVAAGDRNSSVTMSFIDETGLSTADRQVAQYHAETGRQLNAATVEMLTLASIWQRHVPPSSPVHFLKVDVEGFERAVLAGGDWARQRPWIVVVEAMEPSRQFESHKSWENILLGADYLFAYADGLNRFYVAKEHAERLAAFEYPPNVFDAIVLPAHAFLQTRAAQLEKALEELRAEHASSNQQWQARWAGMARSLDESQT